MSEFWYTRRTMENLYPGCYVYDHFSPTHFLIFGISVAVIIAAMLVYRKLCEKGRQKFLFALSAILVADELYKHIFSAATGQWECGFLPLHLCSINIFICILYTFTKKRIFAEVLYALCIPGAFLAILMPTWNSLPVFNAMSIHSQSIHVLLLMFPLLLLAGGFRPDIKSLPKVATFFVCEMIPIYFVNKLFDTNFFFLHRTEGNPIFVFFEGILGKEFFFLGAIPILALIWTAMYLPWHFIKKRENRKTEK